MRRAIRFRALLLALALALTGAAVGCGDDDDGNGGGSGGGDSGTASADVSGSVSVVGIWTGDEQRSFQAVIDAFNEQYPDVRVRYTPAGDNVPTVVGTAVEGGNPPDIATIAQPGLIEEFQRQGALRPIDYARDTIGENYSSDFAELGTIDGTLYSFVYKGANKSLVWFNVSAFDNAGVDEPSTWDDLLAAARTIRASGVPAWSIGGADGWTLTDLFENVYLRQAGPEKYDQLSRHEIPWTDASVRTALRTIAQILGDRSNIVGGTSGALETEFPASVENVFVDPPRGAMVIEGDFVPGVVAESTSLRAGTGFDAFAFPSVADSASAVVGGGDSIATFRDTPAVRAFVEFLASEEGARVWAERGGFSSPNRNIGEDVYPDALTAETATAIAEAETFRFDMSDLAPAAFGGTPGQGEWKILQDFLANPDDVDGTAQALESAAARAFRGQGS
ncbi:MAG TPA: ABC transporter substrate-binding protein [Conexibacter sp.]|nr:ABC transporter substrate-binding protein [Conexibacter sp.]